MVTPADGGSTGDTGDARWRDGTRDARVKLASVAVTSHGRAMGYFISAVEIEEMRRLKAFAHRSRSVADLSKAAIDQTTAGRMDAEHGHLNALLDKE